MPKPSKPKPRQPPEDESVPFLLSVAENAIRDALHKASSESHSLQLESLTDALLSVSTAQHLFSHDRDYFHNKACDDED